MKIVWERDAGRAENFEDAAKAVDKAFIPASNGQA
jgi:hypothetical protein